MKRALVGSFLAFALLLFSERAFAPQRKLDQAIVVPIHYRDQMIVVLTSEGTAAVRFSEESDARVRYRFRFVPSDGSEAQSGEGAIFEKYQRSPSTAPVGEVEVEDKGSNLEILAGPISIRWSRASPDAGWIYFNPETERIHLVSSEHFDDDHDLSRFRGLR